LLTVAKKQDKVLLSKAALSIAATIATSKISRRNYPITTVEYSDGANGDEGVKFSCCRNGNGKRP